jgi:hypothetical protein
MGLLLFVLLVSPCLSRTFTHFSRGDTLKAGRNDMLCNGQSCMRITQSSYDCILSYSNEAVAVRTTQSCFFCKGEPFDCRLKFTVDGRLELVSETATLIGYFIPTYEHRLWSLELPKDTECVQVANADRGVEILAYRTRSCSGEPMASGTVTLYGCMKPI